MSQVIRHVEAAALYKCAVFMYALAGVLCNAAKRFDARLEVRRMADRAQRELATMSDRELHDIGLTRADIGSLARGASPLFRS
jgi:uncharacterized protein YjiS (DUF1127 family)